MRLLFLALVLLAMPSTLRAQDAQDLFESHSGFWMNLHHYLHALGRTTAPLVEELPAGATDAERTEWARAIEFYRSRFGQRRLVFDEMLVGIKRELIAARLGASLDGLKLTPEHVQILERAAPIYRKHRWPEHDAANKKFIASMHTMLQQHGDPIATRLARSYDSTWPSPPLCVDVVRDAGPPGNAYTTTVPQPTHITIGAADLGWQTLELLFHEASHHWDQTLMKGVDDAARQLAVRAPPNLWHAILFYNAGRITADRLTASGVKNYELYMVTGKVFDAPGWHSTIAKHWSAFLAGQTSRGEAIARILRDLTPA